MPMLIFVYKILGRGDSDSRRGRSPSRRLSPAATLTRSARFNELYVTSSEYEYTFLCIYRMLAEQRPSVKSLGRGTRAGSFSSGYMFDALHRRTLICFVARSRARA